MTSKLTREQATDSELQMLIDSHEKGTAMFLRVDAYYLMAKKLQERRKAERDSEPVAWRVSFTQIGHESNNFMKTYWDEGEKDRWVKLHKMSGFRVGVEPLYTTPQQIHEVDSEPVMYCSEETLAAAKDGEHLLRTLSSPSGECVIPLYRHAQQPVVPDEAQSRAAFEKWCQVNIERNKWHPEFYAYLPAREQWAAWEACRAAMLAAAPQEVKS